MKLRDLTPKGRLEDFTQVIDLEEGDVHVVRAFLSAQFMTENQATGKAKYFFYKDRNVTWNYIEEASDE